MVEEQPRPGWRSTTPNPQKVTVAPQQKVNVVFGNQLQAEKKCCQFAFMIFNSLPDTIKKVVVIPANPQAILQVFTDEDPDDLTVTLVGNQYIIESVVSLTNLMGFFPADASTMADLDIGISVDPALSPTAVTVRWLNASGQVVKEELLTLACTDKMPGDDDDETWSDHRQTIAGVGDSVLFSGAEQEACEDPDREATALCDFTATPVCMSGQNYLALALSSPAVSAKQYDWLVGDNGSHPYSGPGAFNYLLTEGPHAISVSLTVTHLDVNGQPLLDAEGNQITEGCVKQINICIPTGGFSVGTASPKCVDGVLQGYKVDFTPSDLDCQYNGNSVISAVTLTPGDGTGPITIGPNLPVQGHIYPPTGPGTYTATLTVIDQWGCAHTKAHVVTIAATCDPVFHLTYTLCPTPSIVPVVVKCENKSQVFCNPKFKWNFNDPSNPNVITTTGATAMDPQSHIYQYNGSLPPVNHKIDLTMTDDPCSGTPAPVTFGLKFDLVPVPLDIKIVSCPNGDTHFIGQTPGKLTWKVSGPGLLTSWWWLSCKAKILAVNAWNSAFQQHNGFRCHLPDGTYIVEATAEDTSQPHVTAKCEIKRDFRVQRTCCDDVKAKGHRETNQNSIPYRMRYKHKVATEIFGLNTHIVGRTKLKRKKKIKHTPLVYWKGLRADIVKVTIDDHLRGGGEHPLDSSVICKTCVTPDRFQPEQEEHNKSKAKLRKTISVHGTDKADPLTSLHYVEYGGWSWTIKTEKLAGQDCDQWSISCLEPGSSQFVAC
ncbi:MAG: PKD domain-containing protein [Xanthobacteraceae bacterium]